MTQKRKWLPVLGLLIFSTIVFLLYLFLPKTNKTTLSATLIVKPAQIKTVDKDADLTGRMPDGKYSIVRVSYKNYTNQKLTGIQILLSVKGANSFHTIPYDVKLKTNARGNRKVATFYAADLDPGDTGMSNIFYLSPERSSVTVSAKVISKEGISSITNPANIMVN